MKEILNDKTIFADTSVFTAIRYEDLSNWEVGKAVIEEAVNRWEPLCFLDGIKDEKKKEQIAVAYDNMAHDFVFENERVVNLNKRYNFNCTLDDEGEKMVNFEIIVFPIIRRVICKTDNFTYDKFIEYLEKLSFLAINYDGYDFECDIEVEFCALLSLAIEDLFNNSKK